MEKTKMALGLSDRERQVSIAELREVFGSLYRIVAVNLQLVLMNNGLRAGELYRRKLDLTWEQIIRIGTRIDYLGGKPNLNPNPPQQSAAILENAMPSLTAADLKAEDRLCAGIRNYLASAQADRDWSSMRLLEEILIEREELVHQLVETMDEPVLEYIWDDEEMRMNQTEGEQDCPMH